MQPTKLNRSNDFRFFLSQFFFFTFLSQHWSCLHTREFFILICSQFVMQYHQISVTYYGIFSELIVSLKSLCLPHEIFTDFRVSSCNEQISSLGFFSMCAHEIGPEYIELSMTCLVKWKSVETTYSCCDTLKIASANSTLFFVYLLCQK